MIEKEEIEYEKQQKLLAKKLESERLKTMPLDQYALKGNIGSKSDFAKEKEEFPYGLEDKKLNIIKGSNSSMGNSSTKENEVDNDKKNHGKPMDMTTPYNIVQDKGICTAGYIPTFTEYYDKTTTQKRLNRDEIKLNNKPVIFDNIFYFL